MMFDVARDGPQVGEHDHKKGVQKRGMQRGPRRGERSKGDTVKRQKIHQEVLSKRFERTGREGMMRKKLGTKGARLRLVFPFRFVAPIIFPPRFLVQFLCHGFMACCVYCGACA